MSMIRVVISVDWEGSSLQESNLETMKAFRERHPDVPMQQFLNAAYFTKEGASPSDFAKKIRSTLLEEDDHGLHLHPWMSLMQASGVSARTEPAVIDRDKHTMPREDSQFFNNDWGQEVSIEGYELSEISSAIRTSVDILVANGFRHPTAFRAGAWMAGERVLQALVQNGFQLDCSALNCSLIAPKLYDQPLYDMARNFWPDVNMLSQPYQINTAAGSLWEIPNNACLADYVTADAMIEILEANIIEFEKKPSEDIYLSIGFHQETAHKTLNEIDMVVKEIKTIAFKQSQPIMFTAKPLLWLNQ